MTFHEVVIPSSIWLGTYTKIHRTVKWQGCGYKAIVIESATKVLKEWEIDTAKVVACHFDMRGVAFYINDLRDSEVSWVLLKGASIERVSNPGVVVHLTNEMAKNS